MKKNPLHPSHGTVPEHWPEGWAVEIGSATELRKVRDAIHAIDVARTRPELYAAYGRACDVARKSHGVSGALLNDIGWSYTKRLGELPMSKEETEQAARDAVYQANKKRRRNPVALSPAEVKARLFIGGYPGGVVYADRKIEKHGDYKRVAFLPYDTLVLRIDSPRSPLLDAIKGHAATLQAKKGQLHALSATAARDAQGNLIGDGQTVRLGWRANPKSGKRCKNPKALASFVFKGGRYGYVLQTKGAYFLILPWGGRWVISGGLGKYGPRKRTEALGRGDYATPEDAARVLLSQYVPKGQANFIHSS